MRLPNVIALEGIDGSAKSTHAALLADYLDTMCFGESSVKAISPTDPRLCLRMKFPKYDSPTGKLILSKLKGDWFAKFNPHESAPEDLNALVLQSLMLTNRFEVADEIERAVVVEGRNVVLDRYWASGIAYGMADGLDYEWLMRVHTRLPKAHCVFIDIPVEESFKRRPKREDKYEANRDRLSKARTNYLHLFERMGVDTSYWKPEREDGGPGGTSWLFRTSASGYAIVNGLGTIDEVHARIKTALGL